MSSIQPMSVSRRFCFSPQSDSARVLAKCGDAKKIGNELLRSRWQKRFQMMADSIRSAISYFLRFDFFQNLLFTVDDFCLQKRLVAFIPVVNFDFFPVILASGIVYGFERCAVLERRGVDRRNAVWDCYVYQRFAAIKRIAGAPASAVRWNSFHNVKISVVVCICQLIKVALRQVFLLFSQGLSPSVSVRNCQCVRKTWCQRE